MEGEEDRDNECQHACQDVRSHDKVSILVVETLWVGHSAAQHLVGSEHDEPTCASTVEEHAQEELVVVESDAVGYPGTVMVHLKDASVALRTVMASIWFCFVAPLANSYTAKLLLLDGHLKSHVGQAIRADAVCRRALPAE